MSMQLNVEEREGGQRTFDDMLDLPIASETSQQVQLDTRWIIGTALVLIGAVMLLVVAISATNIRIPTPATTPITIHESEGIGALAENGSRQVAHPATLHRRDLGLDVMYMTSQQIAETAPDETTQLEMEAIKTFLLALSAGEGQVEAARKLFAVSPEAATKQAEDLIGGYHLQLDLRKLPDEVEVQTQADVMTALGQPDLGAQLLIAYDAEVSRRQQEMAIADQKAELLAEDQKIRSAADLPEDLVSDLREAANAAQPQPEPLSQQIPNEVAQEFEVCYEDDPPEQDGRKRPKLLFIPLPNFGLSIRHGVRTLAGGDYTMVVTKVKKHVLLHEVWFEGKNKADGKRFEERILVPAYTTFQVGDVVGSGNGTLWLIRHVTGK